MRIEAFLAGAVFTAVPDFIEIPALLARCM
jgi:hypothetical protein